MHTPQELSRGALEEIVASIQGYLYLDCNERGREFWNPDKEWSGADVCERLAAVLDQHGLVPQISQPTIRTDGPRKFVLFDFDTGELASSKIYDYANEAADDADQSNNVMVVPLFCPSSET